MTNTGNGANTNGQGMMNGAFSGNFNSLDQQQQQQQQLGSLSINSTNNALSGLIPNLTNLVAPPSGTVIANDPPTVMPSADTAGNLADLMQRFCASDISNTLGISGNGLSLGNGLINANTGTTVNGVASETNVRNCASKQGTLSTS